MWKEAIRYYLYTMRVAINPRTGVRYNELRIYEHECNKEGFETMEAAWEQGSEDGIIFTIVGFQVNVMTVPEIMDAQLKGWNGVPEDA